MEQENTTQYFNKVPPHDAEAEQAVLSSMFIDREAVSVAMEVLKGDDFYRPDNRAVFEAALELFAKGEPIDIITVKNRLEEKGIFEQVGGIGYISQIASSVGSSVNIRNYAKIVKDKAVLRTLIKTTGEITQQCYDGKESINHILDNAEQGIFNIMEGRSSSGIFHIKDVAVSAFERIEDIYKNKGKLTGVPSGFADLMQKRQGFSHRILYCLQQDRLWEKQHLPLILPRMRL